MTFFKSAAISLSLMVSGTITAQDLPVEPTPNVLTLPSKYSKDWVFSHDINFVDLMGGKIVIFDVASENHNYKGMLNASAFGNFAQSKTRNELYTAQTFYSRGTYGERTDVIAIFDTENLSPIGEIILPDGKRAQTMTTRSGFVMSGNDRFAYVFNFTPAASVRIIDMVSRTLLEEIQVPGCSQMYPAGPTNFAMLCSSGGMSVFNIDKDGKFTVRSDSELFNNIDDDPLFVKDAVVDGTSYFPTFKGNIRPIALKTGEVKVQDEWSLVSEAERSKNWRPGGWQIVAGGDIDGNIYILMHEDGAEGTHKNGGSEIWVFDPKTKKKIRTITLKEWGVSIAVTRGETPYLTVTNANMDMDVYDARTGKHLRVIGGGGTQTAFQIYPVQ